MIIKSPDPVPRMVEDYDVVLSNGLLRSVTIDREAGDYMTEDGNRILFFIAERVSPMNPNTKTPAESLEFNKRHVAFVESKKRIVSPVPVEQRELTHVTIKELSKTTH